MSTKEWTGQSGQARVFLQEYGPGPEICPELLKCANLEGLDWSLGDLTPVFCQGDAYGEFEQVDEVGDLTPVFCQGDAYGEFEQVDEVRGAPSSPTTTLQMLMRKVNPILSIECQFNIYVHFGKCRNPNSFNTGWEVGMVYERARFSNRASDAMVTHDGEGASISFAGALAAADFYQRDPLFFGPEATVETLGAELQGIVICDTLDCGDCGAPTDGCQRIYALSAANVGSGIANPQVIASVDGGIVWAAYPVTTLVAAAGPPSPLDCVGDYLAVLGDPDNLYATGEIAYAPLEDLTNWTSITDGLSANHPPVAIFSYDPLHTWLVGVGGYVYFTDDITTGVVVQSPGDVTTATLRDVHFFSKEVGIAVGDNGTVIYTRNGGIVWSLATTGWTDRNLCCECLTDYIWYVGDEAGILHYTTDGGESWGNKDINAIKGVDNAVIQDIQFGTPSVGYLLANQTMGAYQYLGGEIAGQVLRTLNGGCTWYELPEAVTNSTIPAADAFNALATCGPSNLWIAGLADDHTNGNIVHGLGYS